MSARRRAELPSQIETVIAGVLDASRLDVMSGRDEVERELRAHFEDGLSAGVPADELVRRFGDPAAAGHRIARARRGSARRGSGPTSMWWTSPREWGALIGQAARRLVRAPAFALLVIATLALGVGVNTAIFSVLDAVLLEDMPYREPDRLVRVYESDGDGPNDLEFMSGRMALEFRSWSDVFESFATLYTYRSEGADLTDGEIPRRVSVLRVSAGYFEMLGVAPVLGRTFLEEESYGPGESAGTRSLIAAVAVVSHRMWSEQFGADPGLVGRTVRLDEVPLEVVGVMPAAFEDPFGAQADVWLPQDMRLGVGNNFNNHYLSAVARLRDGITLEAAQERSRMLAAAFSEAQPEADGAVAAMRSLARDVVGETRRAMLLILAAAAGLVLLACCVNVMNLLLARGLSQDRRLAVCAALGSGRGRLAAMILTENGLLAAAGGVAGFALGLATVRWLPLIAPTALPNTADLIPGWPVFVFAATATGLAMLVFGLAPAIRLSRTGPLATLRSEDRASTGGRPAQRLRSTLVIVQVAAGIVLVAGATLLARSLGNLADVPLGVRPDGVLTFEVNLPQARYADGPARHALHEALEERVRALPGVTAVGATSWLPVSGTYHTWGFLWDPNVPGTRDDDAWQSTDVRVITGDYFESIGIGIVRGIAPGEVDFEAEPVIWINERLAAEVFREIDPLGQQVWMEDAFRRIVGIVTDVAHDSRGATTRTLYLPHAQFSDDRNWALVQTVATQGDLGELRDAIAAELRSIDPQLVLYRPRPFADVLATARAQDRFATALMGAFAALALVLSLVGTYGVLSSGVAARRREIGIRMALGADAARVRKSVLRRAAALTVPGVGIGLMAAWLGSRWIDTLLFGVSAADPIGYVVPAALFLGVGLLAAWRPALRATQVDTVVALSGD